MKTHDAFIGKYKELEKLLDVPVREYEESLSEEDSQKIRLCRILRNYIQHNADYEKIIAISPGLQSYLNSVVDDLHKKNGILKDHMTSASKYGFINESDTIVDAAALLSKKNRWSSVVLDKNGEYIGTLNKGIICDYLGEGTITKATKVSKISHILEQEPVVFFNQTTTMDEVNKVYEKEKPITLVVNNSNKIVGIFLNGIQDKVEPV